MKVEKVDVKIEGVAPLLMNKFTDTSQLNVGSVRGKKLYNPAEEAEKKTYRTSDGKLCLPNTHFKASMIKAGSDIKISGRKTCKEFIKSGVFILPEEIILDQQQYEIHSEPVVIQRARVMSWRPKFKIWSCSFEIEITDDGWLNPSLVKLVLEAAGRFKGVGDHRPEYGRFKVTEFKVRK